MGTEFGYILQAPTTTTPSGASRPYASRVTKPYLGFGLTTPFQRDGTGDFAADGGEQLVRSCVAQILCTDCTHGDDQGELIWRPEFGSRLHLIRHTNNTEIARHMARAYVAEALKRWEPRVIIKDVVVTIKRTNRDDDTLSLYLKYDYIASNTPGNQVVLEDIEQEIEV